MKNLRIKSFVVLAVFGASLSVCAVGATSKQGSLTVGLVHWWKFNGNGADSVGDTNIVPIGPVNYTDAVMGEGIEFNGSNTGISLPASKEMAFEGSFTISTWALLKSKTSGKLWQSIIFNGDDRPGLDPYALQVGPNGKLVFLTTGATHDASVEAPFPLNKFVLVTAVYDKYAGTQSLYLDGKLVGQNTNQKDLTPVVALVDNAHAGIGIGTNNEFQKSCYNFGWNGIINDLRIYNRAISGAEVSGLYKLGVLTAKQSGLDLTHQ